MERYSAPGRQFTLEAKATCNQCHKSPQELQRTAEETRLAGKDRVVPTMGYLHDGHLISSGWPERTPIW